MIWGGGRDSFGIGSLFLYLVDRCGSEACLNFNRLKRRVGLGVMSSSTGASLPSLSPVVLRIDTGRERIFPMPVLAVLLVLGREADCSSVVVAANEFWRDISSGSLVRKLWKVLSRPSWEREGANERLNLLSDPTFLCPRSRSGLLLGLGEFDGSNVLCRLLLLALVDGRLKILLRGILSQTQPLPSDQGK